MHEASLATDQSELRKARLNHEAHAGQDHGWGKHTPCRPNQEGRPHAETNKIGGNDDTHTGWR